LMRSKMSVIGLLLWNELHGIPSIEWEYKPTDKKNICTSRSFARSTNDISILREAVSNHAATCALKLRNQHSTCRYVHVFILTNPHKPELPQYQGSITLQCEKETSLTQDIIGYALKGLDIIYQPGGYIYMKAGVMVLDLVTENAVQLSLFDQRDRSKEKSLASTVDQVNVDMGKDTVRMAVQRFERRYRLRADRLSKKYTTDIRQILKIKI